MYLLYCACIASSFPVCVPAQWSQQIPDETRRFVTLEAYVENTLILSS